MERWQAAVEIMGQEFCGAIHAFNKMENVWSCLAEDHKNKQGKVLMYQRWQTGISRWKAIHGNNLQRLEAPGRKRELALLSISKSKSELGSYYSKGQLNSIDLSQLKYYCRKLDTVRDFA
jgi:hypothetical protein